ncbi:MAG: ribonuclease III [Candidatus Coatesbacteria bacterium]|nr:ribonuclease III [Candidatus Coatesbacteria bacterium]
MINLLKRILGKRDNDSGKLSRNRIDELSKLKEELNIDLADDFLLNKAFCHRSTYPHNDSNERLEFLGDAIIGAIIARYLYETYAEASEGELTKMKSYLVSEIMLAKRAKISSLGDYMLLSKSEEQNDGRKRQSLLADAFEALLGVIFIQKGFDKTYEFIMEQFKDELDNLDSIVPIYNYKSSLQEHFQKKYHCNPIYKIKDEMGPEHAKTYYVEVFLKGRKLGSGKGSSRKTAEQYAAAEAISNLGIDIKGGFLEKP